MSSQKQGSIETLLKTEPSSAKHASRGAARRTTFTFLVAVAAAGLASGFARVASADTGPTAFEQYMIELINRARANPDAEAARYPASAYETDSADRNEGLPANTISNDAKQPLAVNTILTGVTESYTQTLLTNNAFTHTFNGRDDGTQVTAAGYNWSALGENLGSDIGSGSGVTAANMVNIEQQLFIDNGTVGRGHRLNLMTGTFREIGVGAGEGTHFSSPGFVPSPGDFVICCEDFASNVDNTNPFITGVAYSDDVVKDNFYTPGEGIAGVNVTAVLSTDPTKTYSGTTLTAGGYSLQVPAGTYIVTATDPLAGILSVGSVTVGDFNVEDDFSPLPEPASLSILGLGALGLLRRRRLPA